MNKNAVPLIDSTKIIFWELSMFVYSVKASSVRFFAAMALSVTLLLALVLFIPAYEPISAATGTEQKISYDNIKTNEDRLNFLKSLGWDVASDPIETVNVKIPSEFDVVFKEYNNLQKMQGLDLSKYKHKNLTRYTYEIKNYSDYDGKVLASLLVYKNRIVGGDICSADVSGFITTLDGKS